MDAVGGTSSELAAAGDASGRVLPSLRPRPYRIVQVAVLAAPLVMLTVAGWAHRWIFDDGFIYLRVVRQIRVGHGPVFNTGQRVEAFTSPLWVGVLALADLVTPIRLEWLAVLLGVAGSVAGAACATFGAMRLARRVDVSSPALLPNFPADDDSLTAAGRIGRSGGPLSRSLVRIACLNFHRLLIVTTKEPGPPITQSS